MLEAFLGHETHILWNISIFSLNHYSLAISIINWAHVFTSVFFLCMLGYTKWDFDIYQTCPGSFYNCHNYIRTCIWIENVHEHMSCWVECWGFHVGLNYIWTTRHFTYALPEYVARYWVVCKPWSRMCVTASKKDVSPDLLPFSNPNRKSTPRW